MALRLIGKLCGIGLTLLIAQHSFSVTEIIKVKAKDKIARTAIANLGLAIDEVRGDHVYITGTKFDADILKAKGYDVSTQKIKDINFFNFKKKNNLKIQTALAKFANLQQTMDRLKAIVSKAPDIATLTELGRSEEGKIIPLLRISSLTEAKAHSSKTPVVFFTGNHHAREHISVVIPLMFAEYLVDNYKKDKNIAALIDSREFYIAPVINPDGLKYDYVKKKGFFFETYQNWRKNRKNNGDNTVGVDLNRNYAYKWGTGGSSNVTRSDTYMGTKPFSEKETQAVKDFVTDPARINRMKAFISFHSYSELILYPWGHSYDSIQEKEDLKVFETMAQTMAKWNNYKPQQSSDLYIASGDTTDWLYGEHNIFAFTFELSPKNAGGGGIGGFLGNGFYPQESIIQGVFNDNLKPMLYMLEYGDDPKRVLTEAVPAYLKKKDPLSNKKPIASFDKDISL